MKPFIVSCTVALATGLAFAQASTQDHSAHHPPAAAAPAEAVPPGTPGAQPVAPDAYARQMQMMRDMHKRMQEARTPAERQAMMDEHMKLMQSGMQMMSRMGQGAGHGMGMGGMGGMGAAPAPGTPADQKGPAAMGGMGAGGMMGMHGGMERRMAMMEQMMQMMVDREAAMPRR